MRKKTYCPYSEQQMMTILYQTQRALRKAKESASYEVYLKLCRELDMYKRLFRQSQENNQLLIEQNQQMRLYLGDISLEEFWSSPISIPDEPQDQF